MKLRLCNIETLNFVIGLRVNKLSIGHRMIQFVGRANDIHENKAMVNDVVVLEIFTSNERPQNIENNINLNYWNEMM